MSPATADGAGDDRIDMRDSADVERWTRQFGVSREQLATVIAIVGERAADVAEYLRLHGRPTTPE